MTARRGWIVTVVALMATLGVAAGSLALGGFDPRLALGALWVTAHYGSELHALLPPAPAGSVASTRPQQYGDHGRESLRGGAAGAPPV